MIRLLMLTVFVAILYLSFSFVSSYDTNVHLQFLDYSITISSFFLIAIIIVGSIVIAFVSKILALILNAPSIISGKIKTSKMQHITKQIIEGYALGASGNRDEACRLINRIRHDVPIEFATHSHLILSAADPNPEQRTHHLRYLLDHGEYKAFAAKELARYFMQHKYYQQALDYVEQALNLRDNDPELLQIAFVIYGEMLMWDEFEEVAVKLRKLDPELSDATNRDIAHHYFNASKDVLAGGEDNKAIHYLEKALTHRIDLIEAASLLCELLINKGNMQKSRQFLSNAFMAAPCFELFELYAKASTVSDKEIYNELSLLADPKEHIGLFIAIATYLGLDLRAKSLVQESLAVTQELA